MKRIVAPVPCASNPRRNSEPRTKEAVWLGRRETTWRFCRRWRCEETASKEQRQKREQESTIQALFPAAGAPRRGLRGLLRARLGGASPLERPFALKKPAFFI
jgi:hypothetical protein